MSPVLRHLTSLFGADAEPRAVEALSQQATLITADTGTRLFASGDICENFLIVSSGKIRVQLSTRSGRDIILFKLAPGQACALTTSCLLTNSPYYAEGISETLVEVISIPGSAFRQILHTSPHMMRTLLTDYAGRIAEMTALVDRLTSRDIDRLLVDFMLSRLNNAGEVLASHKSMAEEIGTAREVVSRKLKAMEQRGLIKLQRGRVLIKDADALQGHLQ